MNLIGQEKMASSTNREKDTIAGEDLGKQEVREALLRSSPNRRGRGRTDAERKADYFEYNERKKRVWEFEKTNTRFLALWPASDTNARKANNDKKIFYNMGGNSAVIYAFDLASKMGRSVTMHKDKDTGRGVRFGRGMCSIVNVKKLKEDLAKLGIKQVAPKEDKEIILFLLPKEYTLEEIKALYEESHKDIDRLNELVLPSKAYPDIYGEILSLREVIPQYVKNMDKTYRGLFGMRLLDTLFELIITYMKMERNVLDPLSAANEMYSLAVEMEAEVSMFETLGIMEVSKAIRIAEILVGTQQLLRGKIINKDETTE